MVIKLIKRNIPFYKQGNKILYAKLGSSTGPSFEDYLVMHQTKTRQLGGDNASYIIDKGSDDYKKFKKMWKNKALRESMIGEINTWNNRYNDVFTDESGNQVRSISNPNASDPVMERLTGEWIDDEGNKQYGYLNPERQTEKNFESYLVNRSFRPSFEGDLSREEFNKLDELGQMDVIIKSDPSFQLNSVQRKGVNGNITYNWSQGFNDDYWNNQVKHTWRDKYYDSLVDNANKKYGNIFRNRGDVAAFQKMMGAKAVDGILGPETEALLDAYLSRNDNNYINSESSPSLYTNEKNLDVYNRTVKTVLGLKPEDKLDQNFEMKNEYLTTKGKNNGYAPLVSLVPKSSSFTVNPAFRSFYSNGKNPLFERGYSGGFSLTPGNSFSYLFSPERFMNSTKK